VAARAEPRPDVGDEVGQEPRQDVEGADREPVADDDGVDLVFNRRDRPATLAVQVLEQKSQRVGRGNADQQAWW
jgi:hypothetical protein